MASKEEIIKTALRAYPCNDAALEQVEKQVGLGLNVMSAKLSDSSEVYAVTVDLDGQQLRIDCVDFDHADRLASELAANVGLDLSPTA